MVGDPGVAGQPGDVEPEVGDLGPAVPRPAALPQGVDAAAELLQRVQHPDQRHSLRQGRWPPTLTSKVQRALAVDSSYYLIIMSHRINLSTYIAEIKMSLTVFCCSQNLR